MNAGRISIWLCSFICDITKKEGRNEMSKPKSELRKLATAAKQRLKNGYWTDYKQKQKELSVLANAQGRDPEQASAVLRGRYAREINASTNSICNSEENFYKKVCNILDTDGDIINPVNMLADREKMDSLDPDSRQRYIFTLMSKYSEMKQRYEDEKAKMSRGI